MELFKMEPKWVWQKQRLRSKELKGRKRRAIPTTNHDEAERGRNDTNTQTKHTKKPKWDSNKKHSVLVFGLSLRSGESGVATQCWVWPWVLFHSSLCTVMTKRDVGLKKKRQEGEKRRNTGSEGGRLKPHTKTHGTVANHQGSTQPLLSCFCLAINIGLLSVYISLSP